MRHSIAFIVLTIFSLAAWSQGSDKDGLSAWDAFKPISKDKGIELLVNLKELASVSANATVPLANLVSIEPDQDKKIKDQTHSFQLSSGPCVLNATRQYPEGTVVPKKNSLIGEWKVSEIKLKNVKSAKHSSIEVKYNTKYKVKVKVDKDTFVEEERTGTATLYCYEKTTDFHLLSFGDFSQAVSKLGLPPIQFKADKQNPAQPGKKDQTPGKKDQKEIQNDPNRPDEGAV